MNQGMGQLIDFGGKDIKKTKPELTEIDVIRLLPKLKMLKGETIVVNINALVLQNDDFLKRLLREIVTLKCMGTTILIVPDVDFLMTEFCKENFNLSKPFLNDDVVDTIGQVEVLDVIFKSEVGDKITNILKSFNTMSMGLSGHNLDIIFPDDILIKDKNIFDRPNKPLYNGFNEKRGKKYSIDTLEEFLKTDIVPIIFPTFKLKNGNVFVMESCLFGSYLANYLSVLKYAEIYTNEDTIPNSCIYGLDRFSKIFETGNFSFNAKKMIKAGLDAVKNGVQNANIIDIKQTSILEEFCNLTFNGLFLYDDTLNQI